MPIESHEIQLYALADANHVAHIALKFVSFPNGPSGKSARHEAQQMSVRIPSNIWKYDLPQDRTTHLDAAPDGPDLIAHLLTELRSNIDRVWFEWQPAIERPGYFRTRAFIPCSPSLYDWIINAPSGYRAHYYASEHDGESFNAFIVAQILPELARLEHWPGVAEPDRQNGEQSLGGRWAKLALSNEAFQDAPMLQMLPQRWVKNRVNDEAMGLRAPRPESPKVELAGTWLHPVTRETWISPCKTDRSNRIHVKGFA